MYVRVLNGGPLKVPTMKESLPPWDHPLSGPTKHPRGEKDIIIALTDVHDTHVCLIVSPLQYTR